MPRERAQPLGVEIPLALRQLRDVTPPGVSPLAEDADVVRSLRFSFLTARIPLAAAQVQHLISPERLVFGSAPLPRVAKRPRHSSPFSLADLIARLRPKDLASTNSQGLGPKNPCASQGDTSQPASWQLGASRAGVCQARLAPGA